MASEASTGKVSQAELARLLGVSRPYVHKLVTKGVLVLDEDGRIEIDDAAKAIAAAADPAGQAAAASRSDTPLMASIRKSVIGDQEEPAPPSTTTADADLPPSFQEARTERERAAAAMAQLDLATKLGKLVDASAVQKGAANAGRTTRDALLALPDRVSALLAAEADPARVHAILSNELRQALNGLADRLPADAT